jgi:hypothetical protein
MRNLLFKKNYAFKTRIGTISFITLLQLENVPDNNNQN